MLSNAIERYYASSVYKPFYAAVGDAEYVSLQTRLRESGDVQIIALSNYCLDKDKKPDLDKLRETLRMADIDCQSNKLLILGLGEYLALEGNNRTNQILTELLSFNLGSAHAVFLLRGVAGVVKTLLSNDPRLAERQVVIGDNLDTNISLTCAPPILNMYPVEGLMNALKLLEDGSQSKICFNSTIDFPDTILPLQKVQNPYDAICRVDISFRIPKTLGSEDNWTDLLVEITDKRSINNVFDSHGFDLSLMDFYQKISGTAYANWLYYIYLYAHAAQCSNAYLKYVVTKSNGLQDFQYRILNAISEISRRDISFADYYISRKQLVKDYPDADIAVFVSNNRFDAEESIYKLTDNTLVEQEEIIADIAQHGIPDNLEFIYPDLYLYLKKYFFRTDTLGDFLTEYIDRYKHQKVCNKLDDSFIAEVDRIAHDRDYNRLQPRDEIVSIIDKSSAYLCWIDALGVEYLSFIVEKAQKRGLSVSVNVGRADLPTITSLNKQFYDNWPIEQKRKVEELDDIKHHEKGGYKYGPSNQYSIHLAKELRVISDVIDEAATDLARRKYDRYVIASDHGASRLAVLRNKEEKYETDTRGEHSGRCCKVFGGYDLPFAAEDHGYIVLADYGRFKGSRMANVEVHGGASIEEVVVPVITFTLKDNTIEIKPVETTIKVDYKTGATINLFVNKPITQTLFVEYKGKRYAGIATDDNHYRFDIEEIKRACVIETDVYLGEDLISHITIKAVGKSASMNSDFDDLL